MLCPDDPYWHKHGPKVQAREGSRTSNPMPLRLPNRLLLWGNRPSRSRISLAGRTDGVNQFEKRWPCHSTRVRVETFRLQSTCPLALHSFLLKDYHAPPPEAR